MLHLDEVGKFVATVAEAVALLAESTAKSLGQNRGTFLVTLSLFLVLIFASFVIWSLEGFFANAFRDLLHVLMAAVATERMYRCLSKRQRDCLTA